MKMNKYLYLLGVVLLLSQCREKQISTDESVISSNIVIGISEQINYAFKNVYISGRTKNGFGCGNMILDAEKTVDNNQFSIDYKKIITPTYCTWQGGPASSAITLGDLAIGDYALELSTPLGINKGIIRVDSTNITLIFDEMKGIEIPEPIIKRVLQ
jgi:hypothetical protein